MPLVATRYRPWTQERAALFAATDSDHKRGDRGVGHAGGLRQEDTVGLFKRLTFAGVRIVTLAEGDITHLHIGFKGTMNALFLKDLAEKTHRGLRGRIENGKAAGGLCYGYRVVRALNGTDVTTGDREIESAEAAIVEQIFRDFVSGRSPKQIVKALNGAGVPGPFGGKWSPSTIYGNHKRGTGILNNELYLGASSGTGCITSRIPTRESGCPG